MVMIVSWKDSNHGGYAVDPLEAEGNIHQHGGKGDQDDFDRLLAQVGTYLWPHQPRCFGPRNYPGPMSRRASADEHRAA